MLKNTAVLSYGKMHLDTEISIFFLPHSLSLTDIECGCILLSVIPSFFLSENADFETFEVSVGPIY